MSHHSIFVGQKHLHILTQICGIRWGKKLNIISVTLLIFFQKVHPKLSPIKTFGPTKSLVDSTNCLKNHISNISNYFASNHSSFVQEYSTIYGPITAPPIKSIFYLINHHRLQVMSISSTCKYYANWWFAMML